MAHTPGTYPGGDTMQLLLPPWASSSWLQHGHFLIIPAFLCQPLKRGQGHLITQPTSILTAFETDFAIQVEGVASQTDS